METIVVTGAAGGIGKAIVSRLCREGVAVLACDKNGEGLKQLEQFILAETPSARIAVEALDVTDRNAISSFSAGISKRAPKLAGLVNNAGIYLGRDLFDYAVEDIDSVLAVNLFSAIQLSQIVGRELVKNQRNGVIVNVSSISAFEGSSDAIYGTSKAGLIGLTRSCALTFAPWVRVNAIAPGLVDTPMLDAIPKWRLAEFQKGERLKGRISPEAVASAVWFLLSEESRHTTGSVVDLNNGGYFR